MINVSYFCSNNIYSQQESFFRVDYSELAIVAMKTRHLLACQMLSSDSQRHRKMMSKPVIQNSGHVSISLFLLRNMMMTNNIRHGDWWISCQSLSFELNLSFFLTLSNIAHDRIRWMSRQLSRPGAYRVNLLYSSWCRKWQWRWGWRLWWRERNRKRWWRRWALDAKTASAGARAPRRGREVRAWRKDGEMCKKMEAV